ncbi:small GTpase of the Ras superfamily [Cryptosporidium sp. chipmunk genotype I]|uniref:small GTpase of the Ras superfamily n=1 Tax=Cryptosporidium sp. chipmunk genotype I TaxID=1280935 RepID=UPI00351A06AA|nr:small GTpase of the Ras superfamily [Cryptosporidium sp. chipmunk genotype I]
MVSDVISSDGLNLEIEGDNTALTSGNSNHLLLGGQILEKSNANLAESSIHKIFSEEADKKIILENDVPLIMLCGLGSSGKTSIIKVLYDKVSPHETVSSAPTRSGSITLIKNESKLLPCFGIIDLPGTGQIQDSLLGEDILSKVSSLVFVIDSQNYPYNTEILRAKRLFQNAMQVKPGITFEVFLHKTDNENFSLDGAHLESQRDIHEKISSFIFQHGFEIDIRYHFTSIYNDSLLEAFSKVTQKISPFTQILERLLDILVISSSLEKAFLMDIYSRTFIASDSSLFDPIGFELCADILNVISEISEIYAPNCSLSRSSSGISCSTNLDSGHLLHIQSIDHNIVLACVIRNEHVKNTSLININIDTLKQTLIQKVLSP